MDSEELRALATSPFCGAFSHSISSPILLRDAPVLSQSPGQHSSMLPALQDAFSQWSPKHYCSRAKQPCLSCWLLPKTPVLQKCRHSLLNSFFSPWGGLYPHLLQGSFWVCRQLDLIVRICEEPCGFNRQNYWLHLSSLFQDLIYAVESWDVTWTSTCQSPGFSQCLDWPSHTLQTQF